MAKKLYAARQKLEIYTRIGTKLAAEKRRLRSQYLGRARALADSCIDHQIPGPHRDVNLLETNFLELADEFHSVDRCLDLANLKKERYNIAIMNPDTVTANEEDEIHIMNRIRDIGDQINLIHADFPNLNKTMSKLVAVSSRFNIYEVINWVPRFTINSRAQNWEAPKNSTPLVLL